MTVAPSVGREPDPFLPSPLFTRSAARTEADRCLYCFDAPCAAACPTGIDVPSFIRKIATGNVEGSARTILAANPLGATCGAACPVERLCEGACVRNDLDRPIEIGRLQRYAVETAAAGPAAAGGSPFAPREESDRKVAIVGAGPAGLACAAVLRRAGVGVTVYDANERAGGLGDHGIVPWRLPRETVAVDVAAIERAGAQLVLNTTVGRDVSPSALLADHDAVVVAMGLGHGKPLGIPGEDLEGVVDALDVIRSAIAGATSHVAVGRRVAVIGGGSTAFDAAAAAVRLGAEEVTLFYRRGAAECPAYPHAIDLARRLGVTVRWLTAPVEICGDGSVWAVEFEAMRLGDLDASGRRRPEPVEGSRFELPFDTVIRAVGQGGPTDVLTALGIPVQAGIALADPKTGRTSNPAVWAIGDIVNGGAEVVNAVQAGKDAAHSIVEALGLGGPRIEATRTTDATVAGVDLFTDMAGIRGPNPFWLASCPITNTGEMVARAFDAGWGGVVWKTIGDPITNVTSRLGSFNVDGRRLVGLSNIELISDRPVDVNFAEIADVKRRYPNQAVVVSLMVESKPEAWHEFVQRANDSGADGIELNFGCPHGMSERGMGAAVGQVPEYVQMITEWVMEKAAIPVLVKLTPNVTDIRKPARAARAANADGIALINTISSLVGVNLDTWAPLPDVRGKGSHGGYSGPAVKPIALNMVSAVASDPEVRLPVSGIGGVADWHDAVEFMLAGASTVQVGTNVMHLGFRIIDDLVDGMSTYLRSKGLHSPSELVGKALPTLTDWGNLDQSFRLLAQIDEERCIHCNLCYTACNDGAHQAIRLEGRNGTSRLSVDGDWCVGCRLCAYVCPVEGCITFQELEGAATVH
ncbi:MAG TPA: NAD-dependent dihydropyrimidine dehydrogenase subunit PreA [Candidatus Limnocylindrales bacterium]|nr:NAD-dependent dihydropyrimidine dehydrogenase subunit PreA [Candidatus Limnocylindrales bacterium]